MVLKPPAEAAVQEAVEAGCNRTIMVLKHIRFVSLQNILTLLQSNHHGIETAFDTRLRDRKSPVAIEPLWY